MVATRAADLEKQSSSSEEPGGVIRFALAFADALDAVFPSSCPQTGLLRLTFRRQLSRKLIFPNGNGIPRAFLSRRVSVFGSLSKGRSYRRQMRIGSERLFVYPHMRKAFLKCGLCFPEAASPDCAEEPG